MGSFLHVGLRVRLSARQGNTAEQTEQFRREVGSVIDLSIYDEQVTEKELVWTLNSALLQQELVPFLQKQYELANPESLGDELRRMLTSLQAVQSAKELETWCDTTPFYACNWLDFDMFSVGKGRDRQNVAVHTFTFMHAGKILMEEYGDVFEYMERLMVAANPEFRLANAACVTIG